MRRYPCHTVCQNALHTGWRHSRLMANFTTKKTAMKFIRFTILLTGLVLAAHLATAQVTEDNLTTQGSYGEKKLKKAPKKVYIAGFNVYFHVIASASASSQGGRQIGGGSYRGDTKTTMTVAVDGVDVPDFQKITDDVYNRFVADLKSKGFEIVNTEEAAKIPFYEEWEMKNGGQVNYANVPGYVSVTPTGTKYMVKKETKKGREKGTFIDRTPRISKELDNAIVIEATFAFPFIEMKTNSSNMIGFSSVKAQTNFEMGSAFGQDGMTALLENTQLKFVSGNSAGAAAESYFITGLKKPVALPGVFKDEKFKERSVSSSTPAYYGIVFVENQVDNVTNTATCDRDKYVQATIEAINSYVDVALQQFYSYTE